MSHISEQNIFSEVHTIRMCGFSGLELWNGMLEWTGLDWTGLDWNGMERPDKLATVVVGVFDLCP